MGRQPAQHSRGQLLLGRQPLEGWMGGKRMGRQPLRLEWGAVAQWRRGKRMERVVQQPRVLESSQHQQQAAAEPLRLKRGVQGAVP